MAAKASVMRATQHIGMTDALHAMTAGDRRYLSTQAMPPAYVRIAEIAKTDQLKNCSLRFDADAFMCGAAFKLVSIGRNAAPRLTGGLS
jgi:hypothetical protein